MAGAVAVHVIAIAALVIHTFWSAKRPTPERHVFELVTVIEDAPRAERTEVPTPTPDEPFNMPQIAPLQPLAQPVLREPPPPEPAPTPPTPAPAPAPTPRPTPAPAAERSRPELIDIRAHVPNQPREAVRPTPRQPVRAPVLDTTQVERNLNSLLANPTERQRAANLTTAEQDALVQYGQRLNALITRAWAGSQGWDAGLVAVVEFDVSPGGRISNVRLRPSSGNASFDRSIRAALDQVGSGGPTPTGQPHSFSMTFRMVDFR